MPFIKPQHTHGGKALWFLLEQNPYFHMQRHKAEGKPLSGIISSLRSAWDRNPELFRIILAVKPYDVIATGRSLEEIQECWTWLQHHVTPQLEDLAEDVWYAYVVFLISAKVAGAPVPDIKSWLASDPSITTATSASASAPPSTASATASPSPSPLSSSTPLASSSAPPSETTTTTTTTTPGEVPDTQLCVVCMDGPRDLACVPCGHQILCANCAELRFPNGCPVCRQPIRQIIRVYR